MTDGPATIKGWNRYMYVAGNPVMYKDPTGHVIEITGDKEFVDKVEQDLQKISPAVYVDRETNQVKFDEKIKEKLAKEKKFVKGNELLTRLVESKETVFVEESEKGSRMYVRKEKKQVQAPSATRPISYTSRKKIVEFDPEKEVKVITKTTDLNEPQDDIIAMPSHIVLAHELIHADHRIRNNVYRNFYEINVMGENTVEIQSSSEMKFEITELAPIAELRTVGIKYTERGDITENDIRKESGLAPRMLYGNFPE